MSLRDAILSDATLIMLALLCLGCAVLLVGDWLAERARRNRHHEDNRS